MIPISEDGWSMDMHMGTHLRHIQEHIKQYGYNNSYQTISRIQKNPQVRPIV